MIEDKIDEAVLNVTSGPDWDIVKESLLKEVYNIQASMLDATSWDQVCELRGFARGLIFMSNLREMTIAAQKARAEDAV